MTSDLILLRALKRTPHNEEFAEVLRSSTGCEVRFLLDEQGRSPSPDTVSLNEQSYSALSLYTPPDVAWRCGDYGLYMAWRADPSRRFYWLIEDDVRIAGDPAEFFRLCERAEDDFLCANLRPCVRGNFWWPHTRSRDAYALACLFGVIRLSARAVEVCYNKRLDHSRRALKRALWPNDEGLVATTVAAEGLSLRDFNDLRDGVWTSETYSVTGQSRTTVPEDGPARLYHPVSFEQRSKQSVKQTAWEDVSSVRYRLKQRAVRIATALTRW